MESRSRKNKYEAELVSVVVLTFNRPAELTRCLDDLNNLSYPNLEIIVVDNASETDTESCIASCPQARLVRLGENRGTGGRNVGIRESKGSVVITLDDDVFGLKDESIWWLLSKFDLEPKLAAVNFKVIDDVTEEQVDWVHHRNISEYGDGEFCTYEIGEGMVAFRATALEGAALYPEAFFISHEGPELAVQIMNRGYYLIYSAQVTVRHAHAEGGRTSWRRYYYDTRNLIWLACRRFPVRLALRKLPIELGGLFVYSIRDGFFRFWAKGVYNGLTGVVENVRQREPMTAEAFALYKEIESKEPGFWYKVKRRLFQSEVRP